MRFHDANPPMKHEPTWTLGEVLDLECLCARGDAAETALHDRERLAREFQPAPLSEVPRPALFHRWLIGRREIETTLPGQTLDRIFRVGRFLAWLLGGLVGAATAGSYLLYYGREPVNPFWFVLWLVVLPLLITAALVVLARAWPDWSGPGAVARWLVGGICRRLSGSAVLAWQAWTGQWERHRTRHARLAMLPLLGITQRAACAFALGALLTLWLRVVLRMSCLAGKARSAGARKSGTGWREPWRCRGPGSFPPPAPVWKPSRAPILLTRRA
jgi:hypothetical protein